MQYLFVYGTLKRGYGNHAKILEQAEFVGPARSADRCYDMQSIGYPIAWQDYQTGYYLLGELFRVDDETLQRCDRLEGHPQMYRRKPAYFVTGPADTPRQILAWVYLWQGDRDYQPVIPTGNVLEWNYEP